MSKKTTESSKRATASPGNKSKASATKAKANKASASKSKPGKASATKAKTGKTSATKAKAGKVASAKRKAGSRREPASSTRVRTGASGSRIAATAPPTMAEIAERAYAIFRASGSPHGHDVDHWLAAERELWAQRAQARHQ